MREALKYTYEDMAGMIDHSLLHPTMTNWELRHVASICIKPRAVKEAAGGQPAPASGEKVGGGGY